MNDIIHSLIWSSGRTAVIKGIIKMRVLEMVHYWRLKYRASSQLPSRLTYGIAGDPWVVRGSSGLVKGHWARSCTLPALCVQTVTLDVMLMWRRWVSEGGMVGDGQIILSA